MSNRTQLKAFFQTGDVPTEAQFADFIDSAAMLAETTFGIITDATTARTLSLTDAQKYIRCTNGSPVAVTIPPQSSVAWVDGADLLIEQSGAGVVSITAGAGVTVHSSGSAVTAGQYTYLYLKRTGLNEWSVVAATASATVTRASLGLATTDKPTFKGVVLTEATSGAKVIDMTGIPYNTSKAIVLSNHNFIYWAGSLGTEFPIIGLLVNDYVAIDSPIALNLCAGGTFTTMVQIDANATAGNTRMLLWDVDKGALSRVSVGAADSGGAGYKLLRVPN